MVTSGATASITLLKLMTYYNKENITEELLLKLWISTSTSI